MLEDCHRHKTYGLFRGAHRKMLEAEPAFKPWDARLQVLIQRELQGANVTDTRRAEMFRRLIRSSFWYGWEREHQLESLYHAEIDRMRGVQTVVEAIERPITRYAPTALPEGSELRSWQLMAENLFREFDVDGDEQVWEAFSADQVILPRVPLS